MNIPKMDLPDVRIITILEPIQAPVLLVSQMKIPSTVFPPATPITCPSLHFHQPAPNHTFFREQTRHRACLRVLVRRRTTSPAPASSPTEPHPCPPPTNLR